MKADIEFDSLYMYDSDPFSAANLKPFYFFASRIFKTAHQFPVSRILFHKPHQSPVSRLSVNFCQRVNKLIRLFLYDTSQ